MCDSCLLIKNALKHSLKWYKERHGFEALSPHILPLILLYIVDGKLKDAGF